MKHFKTLTRKPAKAEDDVDLPFVIASLQLSLTVLQALQTKKQTQESA